MTTQTPYSVREAIEADASTIAYLAFELGYNVAADDVRQRLGALSPTHVVLVATAQDRVVGWMHAFRGQSVLHGERVEIAGLAVAADHQGLGVGTVLLARLEEWARRLGLRSIRVLSGSERTAAHRFYEGRGYLRRKTEDLFVKSLQHAG